jgi:GT2 family glycosyltransferase
MSTLDIIIVSYNCRDVLDGCLGSLAALPERARYTVAVVDNGSTDGTLERLRTAWTSVQVIAAENRGFAAGNNLGIRRTSSPLVLLLNPDTVVPAGAIETLVAALEEDRHTAVAGPRLVDANGRAELSFGPMMGPIAELRQKVLVRGSERQWPIVPGMVARMTNRRQTVDWVSGACLLIRRDVLTAVGLLDERFFLYTEDVDLCASVRARGHRVLFAPEATIVHLRGRSRATAASASQIAYRRSHLAFYEKHHPKWVPLLRAYLRLRGQMP